MTTPVTVYNVIILDKSGSMSNIARQAIDGVNETIGSIKSAQEKNPDQKHLLTLVAFCGCELKTIYDNIPVADVKTLTDRDYRPCCMTPLYDAIGTTITRVHALKSLQADSLALVTIITDGYENASREFSQRAIMSLIDSYKEQGWQFTYIGADHDVEQVSFSLHIDHHMKFDKTQAGTQAMFAKERKARSHWMCKMKDVMSAPFASEEERQERIRKANKEDFFID
ncbi:MAG: VWA domain-containing protein [Muribaculaceae bacterium]|nr:VWA domain-containing protein [Muribaculaceae bacterium]